MDLYVDHCSNQMDLVDWPRKESRSTTTFVSSAASISPIRTSSMSKGMLEAYGPLVSPLPTLVAVDSSS